MLMLLYIHCSFCCCDPWCWWWLHIVTRTVWNILCVCELREPAPFSSYSEEKRPPFMTYLKPINCIYWHRSNHISTANCLTHPTIRRCRRRRCLLHMVLFNPGINIIIRTNLNQWKQVKSKIIILEK